MLNATSEAISFTELTNGEILDLKSSFFSGTMFSYIFIVFLVVFIEESETGVNIELAVSFTTLLISLKAIFLAELLTESTVDLKTFETSTSPRLLSYTRRRNR